jgi:chromosome segregation ATPase
MVAEFLSSPAKEGPIDPSANYLRGGPNTEVELGADEQAMLESYSGLTKLKTQLETKIQELESHAEIQATRLTRTEESRDQEQHLRLGAEKEVERLAKQVGDLQAKVLSMSVERARMEQELLRMRIQSLNTQLAELQSQATEAAAPPQGFRR